MWYQLSLKHHPQNDNDACVNRLHHTIQQYRAEDLEVYGTIRKLFHIKQASGAPSLRRKNSFFILLETNVRHKTYISGIQYYSRTAILLHVCMGSLLTACSMRGVGCDSTGGLRDVNMPEVQLSLFLKILVVYVLTSVCHFYSI